MVDQRARTAGGPTSTAPGPGLARPAARPRHGRARSAALIAQLVDERRSGPRECLAGSRSSGGARRARRAMPGVLPGRRRRVGRRRAVRPPRRVRRRRRGRRRGRESGRAGALGSAPKLASRVDDGVARVHQHGRAHVDHEPAGVRTCEFGPAARWPCNATTSSPAAGASRRRWAADRSGVHAAAWNRCTAATADAVRAGGPWA